MGSAKSTIVAYKDGKAYCTCQMPDDKNLTLFTKELAPGGAETVLEKNIYKFEGIYADKLFFYVGSVHNRCLISMNLDGTGRTEWISGISSIFRYQGGWLYFMRRSGHNTVLCRSRLDGSEYRIITSDIDQLVSIQNGYLYYLTDYQALMRIRMNGSKKVLLRRDIEKVLAVREDQIVFTAQDQVRTLTDENGNTKRLPTLSIYSVDMRGSGIRKLVYDVQTTDLFNEDTVYYTAKTKVLITSEEGEEQSEKLYLYALNLLDRSTRTLMELKIPEAPTGCGCAAWGFLAIFFSILLFFGAMSELGFLTVIGLIGATVGVIAAIAKAAAKTE